MKIASFNANGIRARIPVILKWLEMQSPDVLCLQETKVQDADFPQEAFRTSGYHLSFIGQKSYNGVAILSTAKPREVGFGFDENTAGQPQADKEARLIRADIDGITVVNVYVPQGQDPDSEKFKYKLDWLERLRAYLGQHFRPDCLLVCAGDFNVAPEPNDVYDPEKLQGAVGYHPAEHAALARLKDWGLIDLFRKHHPDDKQYTFWDYRVPNAVKRGIGWRIDHILATEKLAQLSTTAWVDDQPRLADRPSDHTFVVSEFEL
ncbi:MAG: exodeoxyribonuclease III [Desulfobacterales bacterium]|nr:exodeoxyribonuclease III [Desulfobacterales bacterium]